MKIRLLVKPIFVCESEKNEIKRWGHRYRVIIGGFLSECGFGFKAPTPNNFQGLRFDY